jgi:hypothetical protein
MRDDAFQRESLFDHQCNSDYKMLIVLKTNIFHFQMVVAQNKWTSLPNGDIWRLQDFFKPSELCCSGGELCCTEGELCCGGGELCCAWGELC